MYYNFRNAIYVIHRYYARKFAGQFTGYAVYENNPFVCGASLKCWGNYYLPAGVWEIYCNSGTIGIQCKANDTTYEPFVRDNFTNIVRCSGRAVLRVPIYKRYDGWR